MDSFTQFEGNLLIGIQHALNADWLTAVMKCITLFGEYGVFWIVLCLILVCNKKTRRLGIICSASLALTFLCCNLVIKPVVGRARPWELFGEIVHMMPHKGDASFPSGHSASSMGTAWAMFIATRPAGHNYDEVTCLGWNGIGADPKTMHRLSVALVILALLIGFSRLYLGMHFPSDVVAGLLLGMICATVVWKILNKAESTKGIVGGR